MLRRAKEIFLVLLIIGFSDGFTTRSLTRRGIPFGPSSLRSRQQTPLFALTFQGTNTTTDLAETFEFECEPSFIEQWKEQQQHAKLQLRNDFALAASRESQEEEEQCLSDVWKARLLLVGAAALYGTNFALVKILGDTMPVGISSSLRFGLAAVATLPWLIKDITNKDDALTVAGLGFEVGLFNSIGYVAQAIGLETTPASESAFICSLAVVTVPLLDFLAGKRLLPRQWIGATLAVAGVAFLELGGGDMSAASLSTGDLLSLVQPFAFGLGFWRMEQAMHRFPEEAPRLTAAQLLAVFSASVAYGLWETDVTTLQFYPWVQWVTDSHIIFSLFWTGVITTALTIYMENLALETLSATETTLIFSTEPLWGTAFAAVVMGEQLGPNAAIGAFCILTACVYSNLGWQGLQSLLTGMNKMTGLLRNPKSVANDPSSNFQKQWKWFSSGLPKSEGDNDAQAAEMVSNFALTSCTVGANTTLHSL